MLMDCNKEEAAKCKALSEAYFKRNELVGAKKYALKAKQLFPDLEGLSQLLSILDVHLAACCKLRTGDSNCYGILQVSFRADDNTIRKQYRKLALLLHPDKNKAFGAEAAFKHISEAWSVLSDRDKKSGFDKRLREHMAAAATGHPIYGSFQNLGTFRTVHVATTSRSANGHQGPTHVYSQHVRRPQGQFHTRVQPQGDGQSHAQQQQGQGQTHAYAYWQQCQGQPSVPRSQGPRQGSIPRPQVQGPASLLRQQGQRQVQGHAYVYLQPEQRQASVLQPKGSACAYSQQGQGTVNTSVMQGQGLDSASQKQFRDHTRVSDGRGQNQGQGKREASMEQEQGQSQAHDYKQKEQYQVHVEHQQEQAHPQQGQGAREAHQAPAAQMYQGPEHQMEGQVHVHQQMQCAAHAHGQAHPPQPQMRDQLHTPEQQGQSQRLAHQNEAPVQEPVSEKENHVDEHGLQGQVQNQQQCQGPAHTPRQRHAHQQGQGPTYANQQQGQYQTQAQGQAHQTPVSQNNQAQVNKPSQPAFQHRNSTFWTACPSCRMQIEYERVYVKKSLCCPMCCRAFFAEEITPVQGHVIWPLPVSQFKPVIKTDGSIKSGSFDPSLPSISKASSTSPEKVHPNKRTKIVMEDNLLSQHGHQKPQEAPAQPAQKPINLQQKGLGMLDKDKLKKMVALHTQEGLQRLIARSKGIIAQKLAEERERKAAADKASEVGKNQKAESGRRPLVQNKTVANREKNLVHKTEKKVSGTDTCNGNVSTQNLTKLRNKESRELQECPKIEALQRKRKSASSVDKNSKNQDEVALNVGSKNKEVFVGCSLQKDDTNDLADKCTMEVPDPDFHNFDGDRTEDNFAIGQVWASYDDDDGMPRYYSCVSKILSRRPLKMKMNWLEACSLSKTTQAWLDAGFQHSCGDFQLGSTYIAREVSTFSHLMAVEKHPKGRLMIYPRQGEVWAVYRDWETVKVKEDKRGYDMVEIVATFVEGKGIQVSPLLKAAGFKTIFERKAGVDFLKWIPPHELRRLSHQVPAHRIMAGEVPGILVESLELDPASTPMDLIYGNQ